MKKTNTYYNYYQLLFRYVDVFVATHEKIKESNIEISGVWYNTLSFVRNSMSHIIVCEGNSMYLDLIASNIRLLLLLLNIDLQKTKKAYKNITSNFVHFYDGKEKLKQKEKELGYSLPYEERNKIMNIFTLCPAELIPKLDSATYEELLDDYRLLPDEIKTIYKECAKELIASRESLWMKLIRKLSPSR